MFARASFNLPAVAAVVLAAALTAIAIPSAYAQAAASSTDRNGLTGAPLSLPTTLPPDQYSTYAPFASYMYDSVIPRPRKPTAGVVTFAYAPFDGGHVAWCQARFRSYSLATDSYRGYDGRNHLCVSP
jgi:hypothetical protein